MSILLAETCRLVTYFSGRAIREQRNNLDDDFLAKLNVLRLTFYLFPLGALVILAISFLIHLGMVHYYISLNSAASNTILLEGTLGFSVPRRILRCPRNGVGESLNPA